MILDSLMQERNSAALDAQRYSTTRIGHTYSIALTGLEILDRTWAQLILDTHTKLGILDNFGA